jgi:hypothetical protein
MSDFVIETQIDKLIDLLSKRRKIALSEAARILNVKESQLDVWISTLEDNGVVELKYPVLGEPEIVLKGILPENLKIISEAKKPESKEVKEPEIKEGEKEIEPSLEAEEKEIKGLEEKINGLEKRVSEVAEELDISKLKEELFETLIIISSLNDFEKISSYLSFIERIVLVLKAKKAWDKVDKDLMISTLKSTTENWRDSGKEDIAKIFEETAKKIEMI